MDDGSAITKVENLATAWMEIQSSCSGSIHPTRITQELEIEMEKVLNRGNAELTNTNHL